MKNRKSLESWLTDYSQTHQNPTNQKIHLICVPLILVSLLGLLAPYSLIIVTVALAFYRSLGWKPFLQMGLISLGTFILIFFIEQQLDFYINLKVFYFGVFTVAWVGQFIGHKIEGKKPAFFEDLKFLLIGPLWTISKIV